MPIILGQVAPQFSLFNTDKNKISISDYAGKNIVLVFFPLAFTGVCTVQLCTLRDNIEIYNDLNAVVIGISVDSLFTLGRYKKEHEITFELLSDFNKEVCSLYDCLNPHFAFDMVGVAKRSTFVIDKNGIIQYAEVLEDAGKLPDFEAINNCLSTLN